MQEKTLEEEFKERFCEKGTGFRDDEYYTIYKDQPISDIISFISSREEKAREEGRKEGYEEGMRYILNNQ